MFIRIVFGCNIYFASRHTKEMSVIKKVFVVYNYLMHCLAECSNALHTYYLGTFRF